ncbi:hypothetical protein Y1Q_0017460 [Alligator mississippiensis]|uniref:Uncharacterized protein n=1 Tax=Alligator mississippiensis TaxID=8496 RepID=A0A151P263_ALLMI|nr:hypothetical protein Y1Q_0017460 [Alligator mississippiensis]
MHIVPGSPKTAPAVQLPAISRGVLLRGFAPLPLSSAFSGIEGNPEVPKAVTFTPPDWTHQQTSLLHPFTDSHQEMHIFKVCLKFSRRIR